MTRIHDFNEKVNLRGADSKKYSEDVFPADVIPMWIADTDFKAPQPVVDALVARMQKGVYGYPPVSRRLCRAVQRWQKVRFGWEFAEEAVEYVPGVIGGIICAVRAFSRPGDNIAIHTPCYPPFTALSDHNGRHLLRNQLVLKDGHYEIDFEDLENKLADPRTKLFILCNPQNPTGRVFTKEELTRIGNLCMKYHVIVLADEIHNDLTYSGQKHLNFAALSEEFANITVTFVNPSKTFNVPGFRTAAMICTNPVLKSAVHDMVVNNKAIGENLGGTVALCAAYESCDYYADQLMEYLEGNKKLVEDAFSDIPQIDVIKAEATYLLWLDCRKMGMNQEELVRFFVEKAKVGFNDGASFGPEGVGFMRMNIATQKDVVEEAVSRIIKALNAL